MVLFHLFTLLMLAGVHCQPHKRQADEEECCDQKMVGDDRYFNIGYDHNGMTSDLNCLSPCIFEKEDQPGSKYCFAAGDMKVECEDDMDYTPTNRPRPTGEMTEGPDGETDRMTDDGMTEDPNGVTGGTTSAPRVITWSFGMSEALECVKPGTSVIFEWSGSSHNVDKVGSAEDYASCSGITDTTGVSGPYTWQAPSSEGNHYFVCGIGIHCSVGNMKAAIEVSNNC